MTAERCRHWTRFGYQMDALFTASQTRSTISGLVARFDTGRVLTNLYMAGKLRPKPRRSKTDNPTSARQNKTFMANVLRSEKLAHSAAETARLITAVYETELLELFQELTSVLASNLLGNPKLFSEYVNDLGVSGTGLHSIEYK